MHLLPCIFRQHLAAIGHEESSEYIASVLLQGLSFFLDSFSELAYKPKLDKLVICLGLLCGLQGGYLLILAGKLVARRLSISSCKGWRALVITSWSWLEVRIKTGSSDCGTKSALGDGLWSPEIISPII